MKCLNCGKDLEPTSKDTLMVASDTTLVRFVDCECGHTNIVSYSYPVVGSSYNHQGA